MIQDISMLCIIDEMKMVYRNKSKNKAFYLLGTGLYIKRKLSLNHMMYDLESIATVIVK